MSTVSRVLRGEILLDKLDQDGGSGQGVRLPEAPAPASEPGRNSDLERLHELFRAEEKRALLAKGVVVAGAGASGLDALIEKSEVPEDPGVQEIKAARDALWLIVGELKEQEMAASEQVRAGLAQDPDFAAAMNRFSRSGQISEKGGSFGREFGDLLATWLRGEDMLASGGAAIDKLQERVLAIIEMVCVSANQGEVEGKMSEIAARCLEKIRNRGALEVSSLEQRRRVRSDKVEEPDELGRVFRDKVEGEFWNEFEASCRQEITCKGWGRSEKRREELLRDVRGHCYGRIGAGDWDGIGEEYKGRVLAAFSEIDLERVQRRFRSEIEDLLQYAPRYEGRFGEPDPVALKFQEAFCEAFVVAVNEGIKGKVLSFEGLSSLQPDDSSPLMNKISLLLRVAALRPEELRELLKDAPVRG